MEITTAALLARACPAQFSHLCTLYPTALQLKAESKSKKPQELIKLDEWMQNELPKKIASRSPDYHIIHEELVNTMRWKLARGKFRPRLKELVTMNSPRVVQQESRKAFRALFKKDDLTAAINYLCNLKGIGPATASALLTAAAPDRAAFMADECLAAVPEIEGIDYTVQEYGEMMRAIGQARAKLGPEWSPHRIELVLWTHHVLLSHKPELLAGVPEPGSGVVGGKNGAAAEAGDGGEEQDNEEDRPTHVNYDEPHQDHHEEEEVEEYNHAGGTAVSAAGAAGENGFELHQSDQLYGDGEPAPFQEALQPDPPQEQQEHHENSSSGFQQQEQLSSVQQQQDDSSSSSLVLYENSNDNTDSRESEPPSATTVSGGPLLPGEEDCSTSLDGFVEGDNTYSGPSAPKKIKIL